MAAVTAKQMVEATKGKAAKEQSLGDTEAGLAEKEPREGRTGGEGGGVVQHLVETEAATEGLAGTAVVAMETVERAMEKEADSTAEESGNTMAGGAMGGCRVGGGRAVWEGERKEVEREAEATKAAVALAVAARVEGATAVAVRVAATAVAVRVAAMAAARQVVAVRAAAAAEEGCTARSRPKRAVSARCMCRCLCT